MGLAAGLRANAAAMEGAVRERGRLLDGAEALLDGNLDATKRSVRESKAVRTRCAAPRPPHVDQTLYPTLSQQVTALHGRVQGRAHQARSARPPLAACRARHPRSRSSPSFQS